MTPQKCWEDMDLAETGPKLLVSWAESKSLMPIFCRGRNLLLHFVVGTEGLTDGQTQILSSPLTLRAFFFAQGVKNLTQNNFYAIFNFFRIKRNDREIVRVWKAWEDIFTNQIKTPTTERGFAPQPSHLVESITPHCSSWCLTFSDK